MLFENCRGLKPKVITFQIPFASSHVEFEWTGDQIWLDGSRETSESNYSHLIFT